MARILNSVNSSMKQKHVEVKSVEKEASRDGYRQQQNSIIMENLHEVRL